MQEITIKVKFLTKHNPDREEHLNQVARVFFQRKGIKLLNGNVIEI